MLVTLRRLYFAGRASCGPKPGRRIVLEPIEKRLTDADFLQVYDSLKAIDSAFEVHAHISKEARSLSPFMADMTCQVPGLHNPDGTEEVAVLLARRNPTWALDVADYNIRIQMLEGHTFNLNVGATGVALEHVMQTPSNTRRRLLRASLGCDEELYMDCLTDFQFRTAKLLERWAKENFSAACQPPLLYWTALAVIEIDIKTPNRFDPHEPFDILSAAPRFQQKVRERFWTHPDEVVPCPILPVEDMNTIDEVRTLRDLLRPQNVPFISSTLGKS